MTVTVIGVDGTDLPPGARQVLADATLAVGARRYLDEHAAHVPDTIELGDADAALDRLASSGEDAVLLVFGDPGFFGVLRAVRQRGIAVRVLPSVSSVQRLAARVGRSWEDIVVLSVHGRELAAVANVCRARPSVAVLTAPGAGPAELATMLRGWRRTLVVGEDLGGPGERVSTVDLFQASVTEWRTPNVLLCLTDPDPVPAPGWCLGGEPPIPDGGWALPEDDFAHRDGMITAPEVRALALARLVPRPGELVWDVGAGSGAIGVECARFGAAVIAVERDAGQCTRIVANASRYRINVRLVEGTAPAVLAGLPAPDAVFLGGGGTDVLSACAETGARRIVVCTAALDRVMPARDVLRAAGYAVQGCQLSAARLTDLPGGASGLSAAEPMTLLWAQQT